MVASAAVSRLPDGGRFVALDSLRGVAALMVALHHMPVANHSHGTDVVRHAWLFVDFFFVLSGFVIAGAYGERLRQGFSTVRFMLLRLGRIYPLHLLVLGLAVAELAARLAVQGDAYAIGDRSAGGLVLSALLLQWVNWPGTMLWSPPSWSIGVEAWLYLGMALAWRWLGRSAWLAALVLAALSLAALAFIPADGGTPPAATMLPRGIAGFGLGVGCWQLWQSRVAERVNMTAGPATLAEAAIVVAVVALLAGPDRLAHPSLADALFAIAVLVFAADSGLVSRLLGRAPFVWLGVLSYSLYLVHLPIFLDALHVLRWFGLDALTRPASAGPDWLWLGDLVALALLGAALAAAYATWRFVEWPAREWSRRRAAAYGAAREERAAPTI